MDIQCKEVVLVDGKPEWHVNLKPYEGYVEYGLFFESHRIHKPFTVENDVLRIPLNPNVDHTDYSIRFSFSNLEDLGEQQ